MAEQPEEQVLKQEGYILPQGLSPIKNNHLNPYIFAFFFPIGLPSVELRRKGWQKRHDILQKRRSMTNLCGQKFSMKDGKY